MCVCFSFCAWYWCLPLILHLMPSNSITNPTALPIQLWAVPNICQTLLPRAGCCDTSTAKGKGDFWSYMASPSTRISTRRTFEISHVPGSSLLCNFEQRLPEKPLRSPCLPSCCAPGEQDVFGVENNALTLFALTETLQAACWTRVPTMHVFL